MLELIDEIGFDGVDAGNLDESWRQQPGTPVYGTDLDAAGVRRALAAGESGAPGGVPGRRGAIAKIRALDKPWPHYDPRLGASTLKTMR